MSRPAHKRVKREQMSKTRRAKMRETAILTAPFERRYPERPVQTRRVSGLREA